MAIPSTLKVAISRKIVTIGSGFEDIMTFLLKPLGYLTSGLK